MSTVGAYLGSCPETLLESYHGEVDVLRNEVETMDPVSGSTSLEAYAPMFARVLTFALQTKDTTFNHVIHTLLGKSGVTLEAATGPSVLPGFEWAPPGPFIRLNEESVNIRIKDEMVLQPGEDHWTANFKYWYSKALTKLLAVVEVEMSRRATVAEQRWQQSFVNQQTEPQMRQHDDIIDNDRLKRQRLDEQDDEIEHFVPTFPEPPQRGTTTPSPATFPGGVTEEALNVALAKALAAGNMAIRETGKLFPF